MTNPNLANINTYLIGTVTSNLSSTLSNVIRNPINSNAMFKINSILFNNVSPTLNSNVTIRLNKSGAGNVFLNNKLAIPPNSRSYFINRNSYIVLNEGDALAANTDANNQNVSIIIGYEENTELSLTNYSSGPAFSIEYMMVGGGGGGGKGGGGAGGLLQGSFLANVNNSYTVILGSGGAGKPPSAYTSGVCGTNTYFCTLGASNVGIAVGGGGGGGYGPNQPHGGSGGGAAVNFATPGQGNNGNTDFEAPGSCGGGGGGGAAEVGGCAINPTNTGGKGGNGCFLDFTGVFNYYAGGGGGGTLQAGVGAGGCGGGGGGTAAGTVNTGGGGGGSYSWGVDNVSSGSGGSGGSGIAIFRHPLFRTAANTSGNVTISANAGFRIYQFNGSGSITFPLS